MKISNAIKLRYFLGKKAEPLGLVNENERTQPRPPRYICFLGPSGIGKSALINALVGDGINVVPAGGIGPFTAQAIIVEYGSQVSFKAEYHTKNMICSLRKDITQILQQPIQIQEKGKVNSLHESVKQARLLITGNQENQHSLEYLMDGMEAIVDGRITSDTDGRFNPRDVHNINIIKAKTRLRKYECKASKNSKYTEHLKEHATGFLAPLVKSCRVGVRSALLAKGLVLVDLPGVGVDGDIHQMVTKDYLTNRADTVVLVISTRGIGDAEHRTMKTGGIYERMFPGHAEGRSRPFRLIIAVTRVDDIANSRFKHNRSKKKWQHMVEVCTETEREVRKQLKSLLREEWASAGRSDDSAGVVDHLSKKIDIVPVSAVEFQKFCLRDPDDGPFIINETQSNIPRLRNTLSVL